MCQWLHFVSLTELPVGYDKTYAEISAEEKNIISHRAKALGILRMKLKETGFEESEG